jgi:phospholipid/cholesterol/gamma-HCH transport system substrate-binding protein
MKHSRIREMSMEVMVGTFMFMVLLSLGVFTILLSRQQWWKTTYPFEAEFQDVQGVREGENVHVRGVVMGKVRRINTLPDRPGVLVSMSMNRRILLKQDYRIEILPTSLLGGKYIYIYEGTDAAPLLDVSDGRPVPGTTPIDVVEQATKMVKAIRDTLEEGGLLTNLNAVVASLGELGGRLQRGEGTVGRLLKDDDLYRDVKDTVASLKAVAGRLERGESSVGKLLVGDTRIYDDLAAAVGNLRAASANLRDGKGTIGRLLSSDDALYEDLRAAVASLRTVAGRLERGEGTIGKLATDEDVYDEIRLLVNEVRATVDDFRETAPITTFTSIFFGAF